MSFLNEIWGSKPTVPALPALNLSTEQENAIGSNQKALPAAEQLVGQANQFSQQQIQKMLESAIPNYAAITGQAGTDIEAMLKGEIPSDVSTAVINHGAARALGGGFGGSGMHSDLVARDLGLTSLDMITKGLSSAQSWISTMDKLYQPGMIDVSSMFITPSQQASFDVEERNAQFQRQWMSSQIAALPDPVISGVEQELYGLAKSFVGSLGKAMV